MTVAETVFQYIAGKELVPVSAFGQKLLVADSWLVADGRVRALYLHQQRFLSSCLKLAGVDRDILIDFWNQAIGSLPKTGLWFPRIELTGNIHQPTFLFRIRKAPDIHSDIRLIEWKNGDFRKMPRHKGPDLAKLIAARKNIVEEGADEALLMTPKRFLLEGLTTSILWWEAGTLCTTPFSRRILPGITCQLIRTIAEAEKVPFACRFRRPEELNGREVWAVNALHGIRRVVNWEKSPFKTSCHIDPENWRQKLDQFTEMI